MKRSMKSSLVFIAIISMLIVAAGCGKSNQAAPAANSDAGKQGAASATGAPGASSAPSAPSPESKKYKIGSLRFAFDIPAEQAIITGQKEAAAKLGVDLIVEDGQGNAQTQMKQALNLLTQKVDAVIISPVDPIGIIPAVKKFHDAGIPVITAALDVAPEGKQYVTSLVGPDNIAVGKADAQLMKEALGKDGGKVVIIQGAKGSQMEIDRTKGFKDELQGSNIQVVDEQASPWDRKKALSIMQDFITKYPDLKGVYGEDDNLAMGAVQAIKQAGKVGQIQVVGYNGTKEALQAIDEGAMYGTGSQPLIWEGQMDIQVAIDAIQGKPVQKWYKDEIRFLKKGQIGDYVAPF
ncbi:sugar ABC transporter substrate-binding protein [Ferviditalea candida]|uniref:Sugar ABC transporter substrate-binding protein n=1 Tax=Ferviditalea candida TaxID=3108399 RepID=A0ABU5ZNT1_9BACL|nr:sugar ABC transporter substrate-binding protein [Paenibacillaceae bacterium T2]